ncbi:MAG: MFS transporter [Aquabacterium sp.]|nr:MFS transporter [Aquabacterium sp.]
MTTHHETVTDTPAAAMPGAGRRSAMPFIMATVLIDMLAIGIIIPVLPTLVGRFVSTPAEQAWWYGVVTAAFALAQFVSAPILGGLSDRYGRRPVLLLGLFALAVNFFATALATELWMLVAVRVFGGAMYANIAVANAYVADVTPPQHRARNFGLIGAMFGVGFILGPVTGGLLGARDIHLPFFVAGTLALINCLYGWFVLPESLPRERRRAFRLAAANPLTSLRRLAELKGVGLLVGVVALMALAQFTLHTSWLLYTQFKFGWDAEANGWSMFAVGIMTALVQGGLLRLMQKHIRLQKLALIGLTSSTIAFAAWGAVTEGWMMYAVIVANLFGFATQPVIQSMISNAVDARSQGSSMGAVASINSIAAVLGPLLSAPLLASVATLPRTDWRLGLPFYFCALLQGAAAVVAAAHFRRLHRHHPHVTPAAAARDSTIETAA